MKPLAQRLSIMLDPDAYFHPARVDVPMPQWRGLSKKVRNAFIFQRYSLSTAPLVDVPIDPWTSILLRCWNVMPTLCLLLGTFSQRAEYLASKRYRGLDSYCRRFLELPLPHLAVPAAVRERSVDATVCGLAGIRLLLRGRPTSILQERLGLLFPPHIDAAATALAASPGMAAWLSITLLSTAASYATYIQSHL